MGTNRLAEFRPPYSHLPCRTWLVCTGTSILSTLLLGFGLMYYRYGGRPDATWLEVAYVVLISMSVGILLATLCHTYWAVSNNRAWNEFVLRREQLEYERTLDPETRLRLEMIRHQQPGEYLYFGPLPPAQEEIHGTRAHQNTV